MRFLGGKKLSSDLGMPLLLLRTTGSPISRDMLFFPRAGGSSQVRLDAGAPTRARARVGNEVTGLLVAPPKRSGADRAHEDSPSGIPGAGDQVQKMLAAAPGYPTLAALQTSCKGMRVIPALATAPNGFLEPITAIPAYLATHIFLPGLRSRQGGSGILQGEALPFLSCLF